jgi:hypothetical protein
LKKIPGTLDDSALQSLKGLDSKLNDLASAFEIVDGAVQIPRVNLKFPRAVAALGGGIGLDKSLNFAGDVSLEKALVATFVKNPKSWRPSRNPGRWWFPIKVTGTVTRPVVAPDAARSVRNSRRPWSPAFRKSSRDGSEGRAGRAAAEQEGLADEGTA